MSKCQSTAPNSKNSLTKSFRPDAAATCNGVHPSVRPGISDKYPNWEDNLTDTLIV